MTCELCDKYEVKKMIWEDDICWVALIGENPDPVIVLNRHDDNFTDKEWDHIYGLIKYLFHRKNRTVGYQGPTEFKDHWHAHILIED